MTASSEQTILKSDDAEGNGLKPAGAGAAIDANVLKPADWSAAGRKDSVGGNGAQAADAAAKANIPSLTIESAPSAAEILGSRASVQDKLKAAESLARAGQTTVEIVDQDGQKRQLTIELESAGKRTLVHVYAQDDSGKDRVVLRAVKEADGSFAQEQTESGRKVSFYGEWWSKNMAERSVLADNGGPLPGASASTASELYQPRRNEIPAPTRVARTDTLYPPSDAELPANDSTRLNQLFEGVAQRAGYSRRLTQLDNGAVYFRSGMAVDADGSPRARQIDPYGQTRTSLRHEGGASVNAEATNYFVLPYGKYKQFGVKLGDIAAVRYGDQVRFAVFADVGPGHKLGEGSMALARSLGMSSSPISGGTQRAEVEYLVFPRSGNGTPLHNDAHEDLGRHYLGKTYRQLRSSQS